MSEQDKAPAPDAEAIRAQFAADEKARCDSITAEFPDDAEFALKAVTGGQSLDEAKAAYADVLKARLAETNEKLGTVQGELATLREAQEDDGSDDGAPPVKQSLKGDAGAGGDFVSAVTAYMAEKDCPRSEAIHHVATTQPELHAQFVLESRAGQHASVAWGPGK